MVVKSLCSSPVGASLLGHKVRFRRSMEIAIVDWEWTACGLVSFVNGVQRSSLNCSQGQCSDWDSETKSEMSQGSTEL